MGWSDEAEQGLPPQRHREPAALRRDILDELSDHLTLAAERESESGAQDDQQVRTRVLDKFGNPAAIARALWWGAMKETIMKDWIQISINAIVCIAVLGVLGIMALFYRQMQTTNTALIDALNNRPSAAENTLPSAEFILHRGSIDGPLAEGVQLLFEGRAFNEERTTIREVSDTQGRVRFGPIRAGRYSIQIIDDETELRSKKTITLYSGDGTKTFHVAAPPTKPVPLDTTTPIGQYVADKDFRLLMSMETQRSNGGLAWTEYRPRSVIVTPEGIFAASAWPTGGRIEIDKSPRRPRRSGQRAYDGILQADERITQTYGSRLTFSEMYIAESHHPEEGCEACFMLPKKTTRSYYSSAEISYDLRSDGTDSVLLDVPGELLRAYEFYVRWKTNSDHGLPARHSWFPDQLSEEYKDFVLDEARLVVQSLGFAWVNDQYTLHPGSTNIEITGQSAQLFSLENVPKRLPDGYKLLLAFNRPGMNLDGTSVNLCAYLDTSPASYDLEESVQDAQFPSIHEPVWTLDADSLSANQGKSGLFVDLTDPIRESPDFEHATGLLFKWEASSENRLVLGSLAPTNEEYRPIWLIMKPFTSAPSSNTDAD